MRNDGTVDSAEAAVLAVLADGPCATSGHTEQGGRYRLVDMKTCRRLAASGLVAIDTSGWASLTDRGQEAVHG